MLNSIFGDWCVCNSSVQLNLTLVPTIDVNGSSLVPDSIKRKLKITWCDQALTDHYFCSRKGILSCIFTHSYLPRFFWLVYPGSDSLQHMFCVTWFLFIMLLVIVMIILNFERFQQYQMSVQHPPSIVLCNHLSFDITKTYFWCQLILLSTYNHY